MVQTGLTKDAKSITPTSEPRTYTCYPRWLLVLWLCSALWPLAIVFSSRNAEGQYKEGQFQWWAVSLFAASFPWYSMHIPRTVKWVGSSIFVSSAYGIIMDFDLSVVSSVETAVGCGGCANCVRFRFKEEYTQEQKAKAALARAQDPSSYWACCVKGYIDASFMAKGAEMERLVADLGLVNSPA